MLQLDPKQQRLPIGGHQYHEYGMTFRGDKLSEVVDKLKDFRLNNNISIGYPEQEVLEYYASNWPWMVKRDDGVEPTPVDDNYADWRNWIVSTWKKPPAKWLSPREAKERWEVCLKCPFNQPIDFDNSREWEELKKRAFVLKRAVDTPEGLGFCSIHKWDLSVAVFISDLKKYSGGKNEDIDLVRDVWCGPGSVPKEGP